MRMAGYGLSPSIFGSAWMGEDLICYDESGEAILDYVGMAAAPCCGSPSPCRGGGTDSPT